jgi:TetR/AcrR family transcriptional regulator, cholesterol catabolism regulator
MVRQTTKEKIINTSVRLFETYGYSRVTVDNIVKESGTSKGGFYHHFKSKDELLYTIHDFCISLCLEKGQEVCQNYSSPTERLCEIVRSFILLFDSYRAHLVVINEESLYLSSQYFKKIEEKRDCYKDLLYRVVEDGVRTGEFRQDLNIPIIRMAIFGMVNWIYKWYKDNGNYSLKEIAYIYNDFILQSLLSEENRVKYESDKILYLKETD